MKKRILSLVLSLVMVISLFSGVAITANAAEVTSGFDAATPGTYNKVTDASTLAAGDEIIIVCEDKNDAISTTQNGNNRGVVGVSISNNSVTLASGNTVQGIKLETATNGFYLAVGTNIHLVGISGKNYLRSNDADSDVWTIAISGGNATITSGISSRAIKRNTSSDLYGTYASGQTEVQIYKLSSSSPDPTQATGATQATEAPTDATQATEATEPVETNVTKYAIGATNNGTVYIMSSAGTANRPTAKTVVLTNGKVPATAAEGYSFEIADTTGTFALKCDNDKYLSWSSSTSFAYSDTAVDWQVGTLGIQLAPSGRYIRLYNSADFRPYENEANNSVATYLIPVADASDPLPTLTVTLLDRGTETTLTCEQGSDVNLPARDTVADGYTFAGWVTAEIDPETAASPTVLTGTYTPASNVTLYAVYTREEAGQGSGTTEVTDVLTNANTIGETTNNYSSWTTSGLNATYKGQSAGGYGTIQLRSTNSNSGIVSTASAGKVTKVTVAWNSNTQSGRTLNIYGSNSAYTDPTDLYASGLTTLGTIVYGTSTELEIEGDYEYIGVRSNASAMYLDSVTITWEKDNSASTTYYTTNPCAHDWGSWTPAGDHLTHTSTCSKCGKVVTENCTYALQSGSSTTYECSVCGDTYEVSSTVFTKTTAVLDDAQVVIYHPTSSMALSATASGTALEGNSISANDINGTQMYVPNGVTIMTVEKAQGASEFKLSIDDNGTTKYLTSGSSGNSLSFAVAPGSGETDYGLWTIELDASNHLYLMNVNAEHNGNHNQALEYYSNAFNTYGKQENNNYYLEIYTDTPHTHSWGEGVVTTAATCGTDGVRTFTCDCGETKTEVIAATGEHTLGAPVDNGDGTHTETCSVCQQTVISNCVYENGVCACGALEPAPVYYEPITSAPASWSGTYLIGVGATDESGNVWVFKGEDLNNNYIAATPDQNGKIQYATGMAVLTISEENEGYAIKLGDTYLYNPSSATPGNGLGFTSTETLNALSFVDDAVHISMGTTIISFNGTSGTLRFRYYKESTLNGTGAASYHYPTLYKLVEETPAHEHTPATAVQENIVNANCTTDGSYDSVIYCSECGDEISREHVTVTALGHTPGDYEDNGNGTHNIICGRCGVTYETNVTCTIEDGVCIYCGYEEPAAGPTSVNIKIGHTVSFDSDLKMNYRIKYSDITTAVPNYVTDGAYLTVEKDRYPKGSSTVTVETVNLNADLAADGSRMIFTLTGIQSAEMGSELRATLHIFDNQGNEYVSQVDVYSILAYAQLCYNSYSYEAQPQLYTLLIDTLNYGAAAQVYFNRNASNLVNASMDAYQQYATTSLSEALNDVRTYVDNERSITAVSAMGFTVTFDDMTKLNAKMTLANGYTMSDITCVKVTNSKGVVVDTLTDFTELSDGRVQVTYCGIQSISLREMYYFTVYVGEELASQAVGYSIEAYAKSNSSSSDANLANMVLRCMYYGDAAYAYFNRNKN